LKAAGVDRVLALVKPQFEAGRAEASRGRGVIRDPAVHRAVLLELVEFARGQGYYCAGLVPSRWPGPRGNREFFLYLTVRPEAELPSLEEVVSRAVKPGEG